VSTGNAFTHDVVIVGAGAAGMSAAVAAATCGLRPVVLDEQPRAGGQIYRNVTVLRPSLAALLGRDYGRGADLVGRFIASGAEVHHGSAVWDVSRDLTVTAQHGSHSFQVRAPQLLVADGAIERPSPVPGWTLPGVLNAGAAQIALKTAGQIPAGRVVLVGGGPLLLLVACQLLEAGAQLAAVVETSPASNRALASPHVSGALRSPTLLVKGLRMLWQLKQAGTAMFRHARDVRIDGGEDNARVRAVSFAVDGKAHRLGADVVLLHHGVVPNTQVSRLLRVDHDWNDAQLAWQPRVDQWGQTSLAGFRIAGDAAGIAGAQAAEASGAIASIGAALALGRLDAAEADKRARPWRAAFSRHLRIRPFLDALYRPPAWLADCADDTIVCRCEEVTAGEVRAMARLGCEGPNQTKFFSRCGMGPCQGRMCGLTVTQLLAKTLARTPAQVGAYRVRAPLKPVTLASFAALGGHTPGKREGTS
jgi:NADPH-dependent 2,4-dienoyl-CoA reductase/sulfur reductase-like enzyme